MLSPTFQLQISAEDSALQAGPSVFQNTQGFLWKHAGFFLRQQVVASVTVLYGDDFAHLAETFDPLKQDNIHWSEPRGLADQVRQQAKMTCALDRLGEGALLLG